MPRLDDVLGGLPHETAVALLSELLAGLRVRLASLSLSAPVIGAESVGKIVDAVTANSAALSTLNLKGTGRCCLIGVDGVGLLSEALARNNTLTALDLGGNTLGVHGAVKVADALATNSTLTTLNLHENMIQDAGACHVARVLAANTRLTALELGHNGIRGKGAAHLAAALRRNTTLTRLDLRGNELYAETAQEFVEVLRTRPPPPGGSFTLLGVSLCQGSRDLRDLDPPGGAPPGVQTTGLEGGLV